MSQTREFDFLVLGSGIAGLMYAIKTASHGKVAVVTKKQGRESNTNYAQGGIASAISLDDSFHLHILDTLNAGAGLCNKKAVTVMVSEGPQYIYELMEIGARFTEEGKGKNRSLHFGKEGGHSTYRIVHAKDLTGKEIERALYEYIQQHPNISLFEHHVAIDLLTEHYLSYPETVNDSGIHCWGAYVLNSISGKVEIFLSQKTCIATGGIGQVYLNTTNPSIATGDGVAMTYRAGGKVANLEFMQFHPTALYTPNQHQPFLISEAVRGAGAILRDSKGEEFMKKYDPRKSLAPRDIVARAIDREMKISGDACVYLDLSGIDSKEIKNRFPNIYQHCLEEKIDITKEMIPVVPAAHYMCGGVVTDLDGCTSIKNLYACGEAACTGVHGANRLASNSLLEALVFAHRAAAHSIAGIPKRTNSMPNILPWNDEGTFNSDEWVLLKHDKVEIQRIMGDYVGIVRSNFRLNRADRRVKLIADEVENFYKKTTVTPDLIELRNLCTVAGLIIKCALTRKESRGLHYNTDYPERNDAEWLHDTVLVKKLKK